VYVGQVNALEVDVATNHT